MAADRKKRADQQSSQEQENRAAPRVHRKTVLRFSSDIVKGGNRKQREERVTPIEPFFDLVFVFAIAQVTSIQGEGV
jgi:low temperature requirement protein LtrA